MEPRALFFTVSQAAQILQVAPNTVLEAIRRGQIPAMQVMGRHRILAGSLFALASGNSKRIAASWGVAETPPIVEPAAKKTTRTGAKASSRATLPAGVERSSCCPCCASRCLHGR